MAGEQEIASMYVGIRGDASSALNALKQTQQAMQQAGQKAQAAGGQFKNVQGQIGNLRNPLTALKGTLMGVAASWGVMKAAAAAWDLGLAAARVHEMNAVLRVLAQNNGIATAAVMQGVEAVKAMGIETGVAQNVMASFTRYQMDVSKAGDLARVAQDAAVLSMQNSSEALNGLIYGITTYNQRVLRTHGVNVDMSHAFEVLATSLGKTVDELTEAEKVQAAMNGVLQEGTRIAGAYAAAMGEPGKQLRSLPRYVTEIKNTLGEAFLPMIEAAAGGLTNLAKAVLDNAAAFTAFLKPIGEAVGWIINAATSVATLAVNYISANMVMDQANASIAALSREVQAQTPIVDELARRWNALNDAVDIQKGIAFKMQRTADAAAYLARTFPESAEQIRELSAAYARGKIDIVEYNNAIWNLAGSYGIVPDAIYDLIAAERELVAAANLEEAGRWKTIHVNQQAASSYRAPIGNILAQAQAVKELAYAELQRIQTGAGAATRKNAYAEFAEARKAMANAGGGVDVGKQIAERQAQWERDRVTNAKRAALEIKYWEQDQAEWIADNAATLSAELQEEFRQRTAAARAEADQVKETDAGLARELLDAEAQYQQDKAGIAADESLTDEERAAKMALLEREHTERVERAKETAALEAQIREEERQREIQQMREAGAAGGRAFAEEVEKAFAKLQRAEITRQERMREAKEKSKAGYGEIFDTAILRAKELLGLTRQIANPGHGHGGGGSTSWDEGITPPAWMPGFQHGGTVPGPVGLPQVAVVHGGEKITPPHQQAAGGITVLITGPIYANTPEQAQRAGEDLGRGLRMAAKTGGISL